MLLPITSSSSQRFRPSHRSQSSCVGNNCTQSSIVVARGGSGVCFRACRSRHLATRSAEVIAFSPIGGLPIPILTTHFRYNDPPPPFRHAKCVGPAPALDSLDYGVFSPPWGCPMKSLVAAVWLGTVPVPPLRFPRLWGASVSPVSILCAAMSDSVLPPDPPLRCIIAPIKNLWAEREAHPAFGT